MKWIYKFVGTHAGETVEDLEERLNRHGSDGWEAVSMQVEHTDDGPEYSVLMKKLIAK